MDTKVGRKSLGIQPVRGLPPQYGIEVLKQGARMIYIPKKEVKSNVWRGYFHNGEEIEFTSQMEGSPTVAYSRASKFLRDNLKNGEGNG